MRWPRLLAAGLALFLLAAAAGAGEIVGRVSLLAKDSDKASPSVLPREAVVYFTPSSGHGELTAGEFSVATRGKEFEPRVLVVERGSSVVFPNFDPILHNVFSVSGENRFDLGLYSQGPGKSWTFAASGVVRVYCNVHKAMAAYVIVLDTPYHAVPDVAGRYLLSDLPLGQGTLTAWHERADPESIDVHVHQGRIEQDVTLRISKPRLPAHFNKFGKPYGRRPGDYE